MARLSHSSPSSSSSSANNASSLADFCRYVPLRLSAEERALLTVLENTLHVSEYTDHVDVASSRRGLKARRILEGILEACHISTGLAICSGETTNIHVESNSATRLKKNKSIKKKKKSKQQRREQQQQDHPLSFTSWAGRDPKENAGLFQTMFEIGRRNKVLNPSQMRTTYGKLMYLLQDAQNPTVAKSLGFSLYKDILLVGSFLEERDCVDLLTDPRLQGATRHVSDRDQKTGQRLERTVVEKSVAQKRQLQKELIQSYASDKISEDNVRRCIESIADAISYVELNVSPVQRMLQYLQDNFDPHQPNPEYSLALSGGSRYAASSSYSRYGMSAFHSNSSSGGGSTLSHSHSTQYTFVWQSLRLWLKVQHHMNQLWVCADQDLLSTSTAYHLYNTGQGLNRVQACPRVGKLMRRLLTETQQEAGSPWVGLSVIHLGDRDVPNALVFIDKYTQIPRFLHPICHFLETLPQVCRENDRVNSYITKEFGSLQHLKMTVLQDYFRHGFDGSGDDGGSCIDGRLTSSWNWTSRVAQKKYYHAFMLSGFQGFDGDFK